MAAKEQLALAITADSSQAEGALKRVDRAIGDLSKSMDGMQPSIDKFAHLTGAATGLVGIAALAGSAAAALKSFAMSGIYYMDNLNRLSMTTGASVESLSGMASAAKLAGKSLDDIAPSLTRLSKAMLEARTNTTGEMAKLFAALKIDPAQFTDSGQAMLAVAKQLDGMGYSMEAVGVASKLMGKGVAETLPFMQELAQQAGLVVKVTTEQARAADQYKDSMVKLQSGANQLGIALANKVLPGLNDILSALLKIKKEEGVFSMLAQALGVTALRTFGVEVDPLKRAEIDVNDAFSAYARQKKALESLEKAKGDGHYVDERAITRGIERLEALKEALDDAVAARNKLSKESSDESAQRNRKPISIADELTKQGGAAEAARLLRAEYQGRLELIKESLAEEELVLSAARAKELITETDYIEQLKTLRVNAAAEREKTLVQQWGESGDPAERLRIMGELNKALSDQRKAALDAEVAQSRLLLKDKKELAEWEREYTEMLGKDAEAAQSSAKSLKEKADAAEEENAKIGATTEQLTLLIAKRYDEQIALQATRLDEISGIASREAEAAAIREQIAALERLKNAEIAKPQLQAQAKSWEDFSRDIERSLTDALMRSFEAGDNFGEAFVKNLQNTLKTAVLKIVVQAIVDPVTGTIKQWAGGGSASGTAAGGDSAYSMNSLSMLRNISGKTVSAGDVISYGGGLTGSTYTAAFGTGYSLGAGNANSAIEAYRLAEDTALKSAKNLYDIGEFKAAEQMTTQANTYGQAADGLASGSNTVGSGASSSLGSILGYAGALYSLSEGQTATAIGQAIGTYIEPGLGTLVGGVIGGIVDGLVGTGGGPKAGGGRVATLSATGLGSLQELDPLGQRYYSQDQGDAVVTQVLATLATRLGATASKYNTSAAGISLGLGFDTDPNGDSGDRVSGGVYIGDKRVYSRTTNLSQGQYGQGLVEESNRLMLAALRELDLVPWVNDILDSVDPATATVEQLTEALKQLDSVSGLVAVFENLGIASDHVSMALINALGGMEAASGKLSSYYEAYYTEEERRAKFIENLAETFAGLNLKLPETREEFRALVESQDLLTESGRNTYAALINLAPAFAQVVAATEQVVAATVDLSAAMESLARRISSAVGRVNATILEGMVRAADEASATVAQAQAAAQQQLAEAQRQDIQNRVDQITGLMGGYEDARQAASNLYNESISRTRASIDALSESVAGLGSLSNALHSTIQRMRPEAYAAQDRLAAQAQIKSALAIANAGGVLPSADSMQWALDAVSRDASDQFGSKSAYLLDYARTARDLQSLAKITDAKKGEGEQQIALLEKQLDVAKDAWEQQDAYYADMIKAAQDQIAAIQSSYDPAPIVISVDEATQHLVAIEGLLATIQGDLTGIPAFLEAADANKSGDIDWEEFKKSLSGLASEDTLKGLFDWFDLDADGVISRFELATANLNAAAASLTNGQAMPQAYVDQLKGLLNPNTPTKIGNTEITVSDGGAVSARDVGTTGRDDLTIQGGGTGDVFNAQDLYDAFWNVLNNGVTNQPLQEFVNKQGVGDNLASQITGVDADKIDTIIAGGVAATDEQIKWYVNNALGGMPHDAAVQDIHAMALRYGVNSSRLDQVMGWPAGTSLQEALKLGLPAFASGGSYAGGLALVGEQGPELINFNRPGYIYNANDSRNLFNTEELVAEVRALREEVRAGQAAVASNTNKTTKLLERVIPDGDAIVTRATV